jgi:hypothetical protein
MNNLNSHPPGARRITETPFQREDRYIVIKRTDAYKALTAHQLMDLSTIGEAVIAHRRANQKPDLVCLVIESDWPEYEPTWKAIEERMSLPEAPAPLGGEKGEGFKDRLIGTLKIGAEIGEHCIPEADFKYIADLAERCFATPSAPSNKTGEDTELAALVSKAFALGQTEYPEEARVKWLFELPMNDEDGKRFKALVAARQQTQSR